MVQAIVELGQHEDQVLTIVKGKFGLKNKSEAVNFVIDQFESELLEPQLRPEFIEEMKNLEKKAVFTHYKSFEALRKAIEQT